MNVLRKKCRQWLEDEHCGEVLFLTGFILYLWRNVWVTTMFPLTGIITLICIPLSGLLVGLKILLYDRYSAKSFLLIGGIAVCVLASSYCSRSVNPFFWILMIIGSKEISFKKILQVYLCINGIVVFLAFCSSLLGVIVNLQYVTTKRGVRNSFGIIYPTDFAAHIFFMTLVIFYLLGERLRWYHYLLTLAAAALTFHFCNTRLDSGSLLLTVVLFAVGNGIMHSRRVSVNMKKLWQWLWEKIGLFSMIILAVISVAATFFYQEKEENWEAVNETVSSRLHLGREGIEKYGFKPFGQVVEFIGFGGSTESQGEYSFVDCSYMYVLLRYGVIFLIILLCIAFCCCYKKQKDLYFLYAMALVSVNCVIAHHILQIEYNPFLAAFLAVGGRGENRQYLNDNRFGGIAWKENQP